MASTLIYILILIIVLGIGLFVLIFFITRNLWCWYFKINLRLEEQKKTNKLLTEISDTLAYIADMSNDAEQKKYAGTDDIPTRDIAPDYNDEIPML